MPFGSIRFPSIQLGLLQAIAKAAGIRVRGLYACIDFARRIGFRLYDALAQHRGVLIGEWLFTRAAFPQHPLAEEFPHRFRDILRNAVETAGTSEEALIAIRNETAARFISDLSDQILSGDARIIGFSSTFEQNVSSLALARTLKQREPDIVTLFGGANFDGPMGPAYMRAFPWIDIAVVGEADTA
ncbi:MAG: RiPP maturation radical SAM protein 1, partial [bacterium]